MNFLRFVLASVLLCAACKRPPATPAAPSCEPRFAIELPGLPPSHSLISDCSLTAAQIPFSSLTEISWRAQTTDAPVTLQLDLSPEGDRARIVSYAIYLTGRKKLGDHHARLNESVRLTELQNLGYLPFAIRPMPALSSDAPSIRMEVARQSWDSCTIALHNLSPHAAVAFAVGQDYSYDTIQGTAAHPVIPAGGTVTVERSRSGPIVLRCVLFDDGTWEGDPAIPASLRVRVAATEALRRQIDKVAARILSDTSLDDDARLTRIRAGISALPEKPAAALIRRALAGLPVHRLSDAQQHIVEHDLHDVKGQEAAGLSQFEPGRGRTLVQFWTATHSSR